MAAFTACLQGERVTLCARVTLASGLKLTLIYKQISQVGLPYHPGQLYQRINGHWLLR